MTQQQSNFHVGYITMQMQYQTFYFVKYIPFSYVTIKTNTVTAKSESSNTKPSIQHNPVPNQSILHPPTYHFSVKSFSTETEIKFVFKPEDMKIMKIIAAYSTIRISKLKF